MARAPVRETAAMIAGMAPRLVPGEVAFACLAPARARAAMAEARALVREDEGVVYLARGVARLGPPAEADHHPVWLAPRDAARRLHIAGDRAMVATALGQGLLGG